MANVRLSDGAASAWAEVVRCNPRIESLNLEGNLLGSSGISAIASAMAESGTLVELKLDHQVSIQSHARISLWTPPFLHCEPSSFGPRAPSPLQRPQVGAVCSATAELELARAVDRLPTLQRFSYSMRNVQSRDIIERAMLRNRDQRRIQRVNSRRSVAAEPPPVEAAEGN
jgi:hypothetical protein